MVFLSQDFSLIFGGQSLVCGKGCRNLTSDITVISAPVSCCSVTLIGGFDFNAGQFRWIKWKSSDSSGGVSSVVTSIWCVFALDFKRERKRRQCGPSLHKKTSWLKVPRLLRIVVHFPTSVSLFLSWVLRTTTRISFHLIFRGVHT